MVLASCDCFVGDVTVLYTGSLFLFFNAECRLFWYTEYTFKFIALAVYFLKLNMSFSFGSTPKTASGFTLPTASIASTTLSATGGGDSKSATSLFPTSTPLTGSLGSKPLATSFNFPTTGSQQQTTGFSFSTGTSSTTTAASSTSLQLGPSATAPKLSFTPILGSTTAATGTSTAPSTAASAAPKLSFGLATSTAASTIAAAPVVSLGTTPGASLAPAATTATTTTAVVAPAGSINFAQLEDSINKWTIDLEEQGKFFINQAKQLNAWDSLLISNGEKILNLNSSIERVKQQQSQLDQELDFVLAQQKELEELIAPLEKELLDIPVTDIDRNQMYQFAEIIDSQLKQMSDDLKEIIENINEANKDEAADNPITQISKILNAHMNSLQWIDRNTAQISAQLEQISKLQEANRRNITFNNSFNSSINM